MKSDQEGSVKDGRYIAYISSYTFGSKEDYGIRVYDVDVAKGRMTEKDKVEITNSSYLTESHNRKFLYSITDMGVEGYRIRDDGTLDKINEASINGMRSCYLSTDYEDKFLFCAGYHDGKVTVLRLNEDGSIGAITDEIYHKGLGLGTGRSNMPHVECVRMTRDNKYVCAVDSGMNRTIVYQLDHRNGTLKNVDIIHADQEAAPRHIRFSPNGKFAYIVCEQKSLIDVYRYEERDGAPEFERIQQIATNAEDDPAGTAASALHFSLDYRYLISSDMTTNEVVIFKSDFETGLLSKILSLPIAGTYPKDAMLFPDNQHLVSLNHESNTLTFFTFNEKNKTLVMNGPEIPVDRPNCIVLHKLPNE